MDISKIKKPSNPDNPNERSADERLGVRGEIFIPEPPKPKTMAEKLADHLPKSKGEKVVVKPAFDDFYRVNWYAPMNPGETVVSNWKITQSRFIKATEEKGPLGKMRIVYSDVTKSDTPKPKAK